MVKKKTEVRKVTYFIYSCEKCDKTFESESENQAKNNASVHELNCKADK